MFTLDNNSGFVLNQNKVHEGDISKTELNVIYPPPKSQKIVNIISSPFSNNQYFLLTENGEIC